jgi:hypothetical protein
MRNCWFNKLWILFKKGIMAVIIKTVLTIVIFLIAIFLFDLIKNGTGSYNAGLLLMIIVAGALAGVITIWVYKPESTDN